MPTESVSESEETFVNPNPNPNKNYSEPPHCLPVLLIKMKLRLNIFMLILPVKAHFANLV
jgi:hypothetical protein